MFNLSPCNRETEKNTQGRVFRWPNRGMDNNYVQYIPYNDQKGVVLGFSHSQIGFQVSKRSQSAIESDTKMTITILKAECTPNKTTQLKRSSDSHVMTYNFFSIK